MAADEPSFDSAAQLQAQHTLLLREYHAAGATKELIERVTVFIQRGCRTGEILDGDDEREAAQQILDHWATLLYRMAGSAPDATLAELDPTKLPILRDEDCPYLGLDAFGEKQHSSFFGRERLLEHCADLLLKSRMLAVIGQSGSGKSSLVSGGLVPALKSGEFSQLPESRSWTYIGPVFPGSEPADNLLSALSPFFNANSSPAQLRNDLQRDPSLLSSCLDQSRAMVLVVDQFEETFTLCEREEARTFSLQLLIEFVKPPDAFRRIIVTMRSEFETWVARNSEFYQLFSTGQIRMIPMDQNELRSAIEMPAAAVGLKFESGVVDALLHDTLGEPAALPMLQFTLLKLWQTRQHNRILQTAYEQLGGARLALAKSANEFYLNLAPENQVTARRVLLRMVRISEGLEVHSQRIKLASLYETGEDPNRIEFVVDQLARAHLVRITARGSPAAQIEVAHEALIRNWPTLLEWIQQKRTDLLTRRRLNEYAAEWIRRNRSEAALIDAELLVEAERWIKTDAAREFGYHEALPDLIQASREKQTAERERATRETEAKQKANRLIVLGVFLVSAIVLALGLYAYFNSQILNSQLAVQKSKLGVQESDLQSKQNEIQFLTDQLHEKQKELERNRAEFEKTKADTQRELDARTKQSKENEEQLEKEKATVDELVGKLEQQTTSTKTTPNPSSAVTVQYSGPPADEVRIEGVLRKFRFRVARLEGSEPSVPVDALLFGSTVGFDDVKKLAINLVDAGVALRKIGRISGSNASAPLIKVLGMQSEMNGSELTASQVRNLTTRDTAEFSELAPISTKDARVLIFLADHTQQQQAELASAALKEVGYAVSRPQDDEANAPKMSEIRYHRWPTDKAEADFISQLLARFDSDLKAHYIKDAEVPKKPYFEVWFGQKAFSPETRSGRPRIGRIFIQEGPKTYDRAKDLKGRLEESGYWVDASANADLQAAEAELRFGKAFPDDQREAEILLGIIKKLGISPITEKPVAVDLPTESGPRHFELLLP